MKNVLIALALLGMAAGSAVAGSGVTNRTTTRYSTGHGKVRFNSYETVNKVQNNNSQSIKVETYGGDVNTSIATFKNGKLSGQAISTNQQIVDPVAIITHSSQNEVVKSNAVNEVFGFEKYNFRETMRQHDVESYSF